MADSSHATNAPFTIAYTGGSQTVLANQQTNNGQWVRLGSYAFTAGSAHTVTLSNQANGKVIADAIKLVPTTGAERVHTLHTDHLNTPRLATDATGAVVWRWNGNAFGDTAPTGTATLNLRFPGQLYDAESGLHYNWNRYYDPKIGRYVTSDPIGLGGGINTYSYVTNNPLRWIDPEGLVTCKGKWSRYKWSRNGPQVGAPTGELRGKLPGVRAFPIWTCTCWWLCNDCEFSSAMSPGGEGLPTTQGQVFYDGTGSYASGSNCLCFAPGPETGCSICKINK